MSQTIVLIGANGGIGLEMARQWQARGDTVIAAVREPSEALRALDLRIVEDIDIASDAAIDKLRAALEDTRIDLLYCNAGVMNGERLGDMAFDSIREQLEINSLGPLRAVEALLPRLSEGGKIGLMTSRMGSIAYNDSGGKYGYRMSKAALNAAGKSLAVDLAPRGIHVAILHPGFVRTAMTGHNGHIDPDEAAKRLIGLMDELNAARSGRFFHSDGSELPW